MSKAKVRLNSLRTELVGVAAIISSIRWEFIKQSDDSFLANLDGWLGGRRNGWVNESVGGHYAEYSHGWVNRLMNE